MTKAKAKQEVLAPQQRPLPVRQEPEVDAVISMIERAAKDPAVDIDKFERLMAMQERTLAGRREDAFNAAMSAAQAEMEAVATDAKNSSTNSRYATYYAIDRMVRSVYTKHGFGLSFDTEASTQPGNVLIVCYVTAAGHTRRYKIDMPADGMGAKGNSVMTRTHAAGSAMTYGQRYLLKAIFNLAIGGDDDGAAAGGVEYVSAEQLAKIQQRIVEVGIAIPVFCEAMSVASVDQVRAKDFSTALLRIKEVEDWNKKQEARDAAGVEKA